METGIKRAVKKFLIAFAIAISCDLVLAKFRSEDVDTKTLVLLDDWGTIETHSIFFDHLKN